MEMVLPHLHQAVQKCSALTMLLIREVQAENVGVDDSQAGIEDGGSRVKVATDHDGIFNAKHVVLRVWPHKTEEM